jgi:2-isopropylmalate synthase
MDSRSIHRLFQEHFVTDEAPVRVLGYRLSRNGQDLIEVRVGEAGGERILSGQGQGTIAAFVDAWQRHTGQMVEVLDYAEHAVGEGTDAEAVAYVQLDVDGKRVLGAALDPDVVSASLKAVTSALNRVVGQCAKVA